ncbi:MAG: AAA family ATPase [Geodermatophilaceae bacterium]|nr:AAA family ATPase [Geodermatophilaceae bacterium]
MLTVFGGLPGTGKTTLSQLLARRQRASYIRLDAIESALVSGGVVASQSATGPAGYVVANRLAQSCLRAGLDVVVDAVNPVEIARAGWRGLAADLGAALLFVEVVCSDRDRHRRRVEERSADLRDWSLPDWQTVLDLEYEPWQGPHLVIDNVGDPGLSIDQIVGRALGRAS